MSKTVILKLISGEEVLATKKFNSYSKLRVVQFISDGKGGSQPALAPFITLAPDAVIDVNMSLVLCEIDCPSEVERSYLSATSGIQIAKA